MITLELPLALIGLGALVVPIAIHALARRTPRELALPTLRFLDQAPRARRGVALPTDRLVLLLRCLALAAFAIAAARPFLPGSGAPERRAQLVVILDDSLSMQHGRERMRFARAQVEVEKTLDALPSGSRVAVLLASQPKASFVPLSEAREAVRGAVPTARSSSLVPALEAAAELAASDASSDPVRVVVASDLDRAALEGIERRSERARALRVETIDVGDDEPRDASFSEIAVSPSPAVAGEPVTVSARLRGVGLGLEPVTVALEVSGQARETRSVRPGERVSFTLPAAKGSVVAGALVVESKKDELAADDRGWFATSVLRRVSVALLGSDSAKKGAQGREQPVIDALTALARAQGLDVNVAVVAEPTLEASLGEASVLILAAPGELAQATRDGIGKFVHRGGGLVLLLDENAPELTLRALAEAGVLPATAHGLDAGPAAPVHPEDGFEPPVARALAALALNPQAALAPLHGTTALLADAAGEPLWVEKGRVVVLGFAPWGRNGALAREAAFPLLVRRAFRAAIGSEDAPRIEAGATLQVSDIARAAGEPLEAIARATILGPDGRARPVSGEPLVAETPGIHVVKEGDRAIAAFAVNASERESLLERAPDAARAALTGVGEVERARRPADAQDLTAAFVLGGLALLLVGSIAANKGLLAVRAGKPAARRERVTT